MIHDEDKPMYTIGVVADLLDVHPETLRIWERNKLIKPARRNNQRLYSNNDLKRLKFIQHLIEQKGLNLAGVKHVLQFYPCWYTTDCSGGKPRSTNCENSLRVCWKEEGTYCLEVRDKADLCTNCVMSKGKKKPL